MPGSYPLGAVVAATLTVVTVPHVRAGAGLVDQPIPAPLGLAQGCGPTHDPIWHTFAVMYRPQSPDTSEAVDRLLMDAYRRMGPAEKMERMRALSRAAYRAAAAGIRLSKPDASDEEIRIALAIRRLGEDVVQRVLARRQAGHAGG